MHFEAGICPVHLRPIGLATRLAPMELKATDIDDYSAGMPLPDRRDYASKRRCGNVQKSK